MRAVQTHCPGLVRLPFPSVGFCFCLWDFHTDLFSEDHQGTWGLIFTILEIMPIIFGCDVQHFFIIFCFCAFFFGVTFIDCWSGLSSRVWSRPWTSPGSLLNSSPSPCCVCVRLLNVVEKKKKNPMSFASERKLIRCCPFHEDNAGFSVYSEGRGESFPIITKSVAYNSSCVLNNKWGSRCII